MSSNFNRVLGRWDIFTLAFGAMIGWGWIVLTGEWIITAGVWGAILAFLIGGTIVSLVGLTYSELTSAMPKVGGEHVFSYRGIGLNASFLCTWFIILGYVSVCAFEAVALPIVLENLVTFSKQSPLYSLSGQEIYFHSIWIGIAGTLAIGTLNYFGVKSAALMQAIFTSIILVVGLMLIFGSLFSPINFSSTLEISANMDLGKGLLAVLVMTPFMFVGFDVIPQAAEEINLPFRQIGRILIASIIVAVIWYAAIIFSVGTTLDQQELSSNALAPAIAMQKIFGGVWAKNLLIFAGLAGILTSWNSFFVGATRAIYAMGHSKMLPSFFASLHPKYKSPTGAILFVTLSSILATLFGKEALGWLVNAGGMGIVISWSLVALSFYLLRKKEPAMVRPFRVPNGKLIGLTAFMLSLGLLYLYLPGNSSALNYFEWGIIGVWSFLGLALFFMAVKKEGKQEMNKMMSDHLQS